MNDYTFGDNDVAADRLRLLAEAFAPSTRTLLRHMPAERHSRIIDLGCGPGFTTELLRGELEPDEIIGIERSPRLLAMARSRTDPRVRYVEHDVTVIPFPAPRADLLYARFLLTHLTDVRAVLARWLQAVTPSGWLAIEETADLRSSHPIFRRYYEMVERMQDHYGQTMYIGLGLDALCEDAGWRIRFATTRRLAMPAARMARLHALNLRTWSQNPFIRSAYTAQELSAVGNSLDAIADGGVAPPVECALRQLLVEPALPLAFATK